jgi:hypothetical protein
VVWYPPAIEETWTMVPEIESLQGIGGSIKK